MKNPSLSEYAGKRNFQKTAEPPPKVAPAGAKAPLFVIQKHAASHLHYDFRLEIGGVLKSWAVPKGPPYQRGDKRLAMRVEDHPFDYARFEGTIPEGNYGAGTVMVWDIGVFEVEGDPAKGLEEGKLHLTLRGRKLKGEWALVRMHGRKEMGKDPWLLLKGGESMTPLTREQDDRSALSRRTMSAIAGNPAAEWQSNRGAARRTPARSKPAPAAAPPPRLPKGLPAGKLRFVEPMYCQLSRAIPSGAGWQYELKFDGIRALAIKNGKDVQLFSRLGNSVAERFPEVVKHLRELPCEKAMLDGEVVALEPSGRSSFQLLQMSRMPGHKPPPIRYYAFDLLNLEGKDLTGLPLAERKDRLQALLPKDQDILRFSASLSGDPKKLLQQVRERGMEGLIAKKVDSPYEPGRRRGAWLKLKCVQQQEFVIGGYTAPRGSRSHFGALLVGYHQGGRLLFASKVGTGFDHDLLKSLFSQLQKLRNDECPFANLPEARSGRYGQGLTASEMKRCAWVRPELVCEIIFSEWTRDGHLRQPVFVGLRDDKKPSEVLRESPVLTTDDPG